MTVMSALAGLVGCLVAEPAPVTCDSCHGFPPPVALGGGTDPTERGVGAHAAHLEPAFSRPVACEECHLVPETVGAEGHIDTPWPAEVVWAPEGLAVLDGAEPFDVEALSCTVYCHGAGLTGAGLTGGSSTVPVWTEPGSAPCGSCHGDPPPPPHPQNDQCSQCHAPAAGDPEMHIDGVLTVDGGQDGGCTACHGQGNNPAPPPDTLGNTDTSETSVGAHDAHVLGGELGAPVACDDCHQVPGATEDPGHIDPSPAEVVFSGRAELGGADPDWNGTSCGDTYCHGPAQPQWTVVNGSQVPCGSCHALPPPEPDEHDLVGPEGGCGCHSTTGGDRTIDLPGQHINGSVEL
jgi:predicted CxxxxCH...CXXCH cytochrome family protein